LRFAVVLVRPLYSGNLGSVARVMANFGIERLYVVGDLGPDDESRMMAMHGLDVLEGLRNFATLAEVPIDVRVATTGRVSTSEKRERRFAVAAADLRGRLMEHGGTIGIVFGPEDSGLSNDEVEMCDIVATIPATPEYPILNLSHAVAIFLYELSKQSWDLPVKEMATAEERDCLLRRVEEVMEWLGYDGPRKERVSTYMRRILGREGLTKWEFHGLMGLFSDALNGPRAGRAAKKI